MSRRKGKDEGATEALVVRLVDQHAEYRRQRRARSVRGKFRYEGVVGRPGELMGREDGGAHGRSDRRPIRRQAGERAATMRRVIGVGRLSSRFYCERCGAKLVKGRCERCP